MNYSFKILCPFGTSGATDFEDKTSPAPFSERTFSSEQHLPQHLLHLQLEVLDQVIWL